MADTPARAVPLDGPRLVRMCRARADAILAAGPDLLADETVATHAAQWDALAAALPGLLADAALLDFMEQHPTDVSYAIGYQRQRGSWCWKDGQVVREASGLRQAVERARAVFVALSRALPEGGV